MKLDKTSVEILAKLFLPEIRAYVVANPDAYAAFLKSEQDKKKQEPPPRRRKSRKQT